MKAVLIGKFTALQAYIKNTRKISNYLTLYLKELEKEQQIKPKVCRRKEKIIIRAEVNERDKKHTKDQ